MRLYPLERVAHNLNPTVPCGCASYVSASVFCFTLSCTTAELLQRTLKLHSSKLMKKRNQRLLQTLFVGMQPDALSKHA